MSSNEELEFSRTFSCSNGYKYKLIAIISEKILQEKVLYSLVYYNERTSVYKVFADVRCYEVENDIFEKRKGSRFTSLKKDLKNQIFINILEWKSLFLIPTKAITNFFIQESNRRSQRKKNHKERQ